MGRKSPEKKREKRHKQKMKRKKFKHLTYQENGSSPSSLGSPRSPPESISEVPIKCLSSKDANLYGFDEAVFAYQEDDSNEFKMEDGKCLTGDELVGHLRSSNRVLADKAGMYQRKFETIEYLVHEKELECAQKVKKIREFYRDMLYYSNSRSAVIFKKAMSNGSQHKC